jgi:hypothetical protein
MSETPEILSSLLIRLKRYMASIRLENGMR